MRRVVVRYLQAAGIVLGICAALLAVVTVVWFLVTLWQPFIIVIFGVLVFVCAVMAIADELDH